MTDKVTLRLAEEMVALCNASPRTPSVEDFIDWIEEVIVSEGGGIVIPQGTAVRPNPGASLTVNEHMGLEMKLWSFVSPVPLTPQQQVLSVLEWIRHGVLTAPRLN